MRQIPRSSILPYCALPALSEPNMVGIGADGGVSSMQNLRHETFYRPANSMPSVRGSPASESTHDLILRERDSLLGPSVIPRHSGAVVSNHIVTRSSHPHVGLERNFLNCGYCRQPECNDYNMLLHPHHGLFQQRSNINYQQRQQSIGHRSSSPYLTAVGTPGLKTSPHDAGATQPMINQRIGMKPNQLRSIGHHSSSPNFAAAGMYGLQASQHNTEAAQQMINQRIGLQPNQLGSVDTFQESFLKSNYNSSYAQLFKDEPSRTTEQPQLQFNENKVIKESQGPTNQGTKDSPVMVTGRIQKCKEECLQDIMKMHRLYLSQMPQCVSEIVRDSVVKMVFQIEDMMKLLNLQRSSIEHKVAQKVHKNIDGIYFFIRYMRNKYPVLFAGPGEESKSKHGKHQTVLSTIVDENHTHQKQYLLQQEAAATSEAENSVVSPFQPTKTSRGSCPIDANQSKNLHQEAATQSSPIDRLIKVVSEASPETLMRAAQDIFAVTSAADRIYEIPAYGDGRTYICDDLAAWTNYNLQTKEVPNQRIKRNFNVVAMNSIYDGLIDSGSHMLNNSQSSIQKAKRQKVEVNKNLMTEIEFLNGKLLETQVVIVKPDASLPTLEGGSEITASCTFLAASYKALNTLSHLFPVRMQLRIPRDYPQSKPTILPCRHQNCGQMCAMLQMKYEHWSRCSEMNSVKEIVQSWNDCARELYADICLGSSGKSRNAKFDTWEIVMV